MNQINSTHNNLLKIADNAFNNLEMARSHASSPRNIHMKFLSPDDTMKLVFEEKVVFTDPQGIAHLERYTKQFAEKVVSSLIDLNNQDISHDSEPYTSVFTLAQRVQKLNLLNTSYALTPQDFNNLKNSCDSSSPTKAKDSILAKKLYQDLDAIKNKTYIGEYNATELKELASKFEAKTMHHLANWNSIRSLLSAFINFFKGYGALSSTFISVDAIPLEKLDEILEKILETATTDGTKENSKQFHKLHRALSILHQDFIAEAKKEPTDNGDGKEDHSMGIPRRQTRFYEGGFADQDLIEKLTGLRDRLGALVNIIEQRHLGKLPERDVASATVKIPIVEATPVEEDSSAVKTPIVEATIVPSAPPYKEG